MTLFPGLVTLLACTAPTPVTVHHSHADADQVIELPDTTPSGTLSVHAGATVGATGDGILQLRTQDGALVVSVTDGDTLPLPSVIDGAWTDTCFDPGSSCPDTVSRRSGGITEAWTAESHRLWHRIRVDSEADLLRLRIHGPSATVDGPTALVLRSQSRTWRYDGLAGWDAEGNDLELRFEEERGGVRVVPGQPPAAWPVWIDPWLTVPDAQYVDRWIDLDSMGIGDINGDGFDDLMNDIWTQYHVILGGATGLDTNVILGGDSDYGYYPHFPGADVNGDGLADLLIGCSAGQNEVVRLGVPGGVLAAAHRFPSVAHPYLFCDTAGGDFDGDMDDDVVQVRCDGTTYGNGQCDHLVFAGGPSYQNHTLMPPVEVPDLVTPYTHRMSTGDVNGDGYDDLVAGYTIVRTTLTPRTGSDAPFDAFLWLGSPSGLEYPIVWRLTDHVASIHTTRQISSGEEVEAWVMAASILGDLNGDGFDDIVLGGNGGQLSWVAGSPAVPADPVVFAQMIPACSAYLDEVDMVRSCEWSIADVQSAGDVNADGYDDLFWQVPGGAALFLGTPFGPMDHAYAIYETDIFPGSAKRVRRTGDLNGDGFDDVALRTFRYYEPPLTGGVSALSVWNGAPTPDPDQDGFLPPEDCNPWISTAFPGGVEVAGTRWDEDCDGEMTCFVDVDGDGTAGPTTVNLPSNTDGCEASGAYSAVRDCDDADAAIGPHVADIADNDIDEDCDGRWTCHADGDGDGFGSIDARADRLLPCSEDPSANLDQLDCDDNRADVNPAVADLPASGVDEDCDGHALCASDADGDGYLGTGNPTLSPDDSCDHPGMSAVSTDCVDTNPAVHPGASEVTGDPVDDDCNGALSCFRDFDLDGLGGSLDAPSNPYYQVVGGTTCDVPGFASTNTDCYDGSAEVYPGHPEVRDDLDNDCDGWFLCGVDVDLDGYGGNTGPADLVYYSQPRYGCYGGRYGTGNGVGAGDCDDTNPTVYPGAPEFVNDIDEDCNGWLACAIDGDGDGYGAYETEDGNWPSGPTVHFTPAEGCDHPEARFTYLTGDCYDYSASRHPGAIEVVGDIFDDDCNGLVTCYTDRDGDRWGSAQTTEFIWGPWDNPSCDRPAEGVSHRSGDCQDRLAQANPTMLDVPGDGLDQSCDGVDGFVLTVDDTARRRLQVDLAGAGARTGVTLALSTVGPGQGPCPAALRRACVGVLSPRIVGEAHADPTGNAHWTLDVPAGVRRGTHVWLQAWVPNTRYGSPVVEAVVR